MSLILDEFDRVKLSCLLGQEYAKQNPEVAEGVLNANVYRLQFLDSLNIKSKIFDLYRNRLKQRGAVQESKTLTEFTKLTLACDVEKKEPYHLK